jgi:hypothetical protein
LIDPETGKRYNFNKSNHHAAKYLETWINKQVGIDNLNIPSGLKKGLNTLNRNLTAATLMLNFRTMLIQPTALLQTATLFGPFRTLKGVTEAALGKKHPAMEYSTELKTRVMDAAVADPANVIAGTAYQKGRAMAETVGMFGMKLMDGKSADATWRTAFDYYKEKNPKMSDRMISRMADEAVVKTQASGSPEDLSPIQRNALGKTITLWQTFTIQNLNFIARDVLGIKNPNITKAEVLARSTRFIIGVALINALFEDAGDITSPFPRPVETLKTGLEEGDPKVTLLLRTMLESGELLPLLSGLKFGTTPLGAGVQYAQQVTDIIGGTDVTKQDVIQKAIDGDRRSQLLLADLIGVAFGIPGSKQVTKFVRGQDRDESIPRSLIGRKFGSDKEGGLGNTLPGRRKVERRSGSSVRRREATGRRAVNR